MKNNKFMLIMLSIFLFSSQVFAAEKFVRKYSEDIDLTKSSVEADVGRYHIKADMSRPAKPFREIVFRFHITRDGEPVALDEGEVKFNMVMDMGLYKARLQKAATGYSAKITLPKCIFGGERWFAKLEFEEGKFSAEKVFLFDMDEK
ncbi:MAG: hypothetical protein AB7U93_08675 [Deferribacterales bacterium]